MVVLLISYFESQSEIALQQALVVAAGASSRGLTRQRVANDEALRRSQLVVSTLTDSQLAHSVNLVALIDIRSPIMYIMDT
jgi:hypothetical protein